MTAYQISLCSGSSEVFSFVLFLFHAAAVSLYLRVWRCFVRFLSLCLCVCLSVCLSVCPAVCLSGSECVSLSVVADSLKKECQAGRPPCVESGQPSATQESTQQDHKVLHY